MAAIARGDHQAFLELHGRYQRRCVSVARRVLARQEGVADVVQSVFLEVWRGAAPFDSSLGSVGTWLLAVTHHRAVDYVRHEQAQRRRAEVASALPQWTAAELDPEACFLRTAEQRQVAQALADLQPRQREVLVLAYYGGHTQRQIAALLETPLGTVKSRARDGLRHLRSHLDLD